MIANCKLIRDQIEKGILTVTALLENVMISWRRKYEAISSPN